MDKSRLSAEAARLERNKKRLSQLPGCELPSEEEKKEEKKEKEEKEEKKKNRFDFIFKLVLVGDSSSGKTSLMRRYVDNVFEEQTLTTIGVDFTVKTIVINGSTVKLQIWDTAGQERFAPLGGMYYNGAQAAIFTYDITNKKTLESLPRWIQKFDDRNEGNDSVKVIVGCKSDLEERRVVTSSSGQRAAIELQARWSETSSQSGLNVDKMFTEIAEAVLERRQQELGLRSQSRREKAPHISGTEVTVEPESELKRGGTAKTSSRSKPFKILRNLSGGSLRSKGTKGGNRRKPLCSMLS